MVWRGVYVTKNQNLPRYFYYLYRRFIISAFSITPNLISYYNTTFFCLFSHPSATSLLSLLLSASVISRQLSYYPSTFLPVRSTVLRCPISIIALNAFAYFWHFRYPLVSYVVTALVLPLAYSPSASLVSHWLISSPALVCLPLTFATLLYIKDIPPHSVIRRTISKTSNTFLLSHPLLIPISTLLH